MKGHFKSLLLAASLGLSAIVSLPAAAEWYADKETSCRVWANSPKDAVDWVGSCVDARASGHGTLIYFYTDNDTGEKKTSTYVGEMAGGKFHGKGRFEGGSGTIYDGAYKDHEEHGFGIKHYTDGDRYEGQWDDGVRKGQGKYFWPNGDWYSGQWDNLRNGFGTFHWQDGRRKEGQWKDDKSNGPSVFYRANGEKGFEGFYKNDKRHGLGTAYLSDGRVQQGQWENGKFVERKTPGSRPLLRATGETVPPSRPKPTEVKTPPPDPGQKMRGQVSAFKFPANTCGEPKRVTSSMSRSERTQIDNRNDDWVSCLKGEVQKDKTALRSLIVDRLGGTWEVNGDQINWSVDGRCNCLEDVKKLWAKKNNRVAARQKKINDIAEYNSSVGNAECERLAREVDEATERAEDAYDDVSRAQSDYDSLLTQLRNTETTTSLMMTRLKFCTSAGRNCYTESVEYDRSRNHYINLQSRVESEGRWLDDQIDDYNNRINPEADRIIRNYNQRCAD